VTARQAAALGEHPTVTLDDRVIDDRMLALVEPFLSAGTLDVKTVAVSDHNLGTAWHGRVVALAERSSSGHPAAEPASHAGREEFIETVLYVISAGSFPLARDHLTPDRRRQLHNAIALEAHARDERDVFVTEDTESFISDGRRARLEKLCSTSIMRVAEFEEFLERLPA
jgi:hypothetical protein